MPANRDQLTTLKNDFDRARARFEQEHHPAALAGMREIIARVEELTGARSAYLLYCVAMAQKEVKDAEGAFETLCAVVQADPVNPVHAEFFSETASSLRKRLEFHAHRPTEPHAPRLYETLLRAGEADARSHVMWAKCLIATERLDEAAKVLEATLLLEPSRADAWEQKAHLARTRGEVAEAEACEARAKELALHSAPFGVPSPPAEC